MQSGASRGTQDSDFVRLGILQADRRRQFVVPSVAEPPTDAAPSTSAVKGRVRERRVRHWRPSPRLFLSGRLPSLQRHRLRLPSHTFQRTSQTITKSALNSPYTEYNIPYI
jgi:hypothetical protein